MKTPFHNIKPDMRAIINNFREGKPVHGQSTPIEPQDEDYYHSHADRFIEEIQEFDGATGYRRDTDCRTGRFEHQYDKEVSMTDAGIYVNYHEVGDVGERHANTERTRTQHGEQSWDYTFAERTEDGGCRYISIHGEGIEYHGEAFEVAPDGTGQFTHIQPVRARGF